MYRFALLFVFASCFAQEHVIDTVKKPSYLYVQSAQSGSFDGRMLSLRDVPMVVYFSDRPYRIAGHMDLKKFVTLWKKRADSFKKDPPSSTLSIFDERSVKNVVVVLSNPKVRGDDIIYEIKILEGEVPRAFGPASLFIDMDLFR